MVDLKKIIDETVEEKHLEIWNISEYLFANPEEGLKEFKAVEVQKQFLKENGFEIEENVADLPTAFIASFTTGKGPTIGVFSEYDCLPDGLGHACGHNLITASTMACAIGAKKAMVENNVKGTLKIIGAPDEEFTGGKIALLKAGKLADLDCAMAIHPTSGISRVNGGNNAYLSYVCKYEGVASSAGNQPWMGVSAQDAALLFFNALGYARQMIRDGVRVTASIDSGVSTLGTISASSQVSCDLSAKNIFELEEAATRIENCFKAGAVGTGCSYKLKRMEASKNRIPNAIMADIFRNNCVELGEQMQHGMPDDNGGEDLGNVSHIIPCINPHLSVFKERKISLHTVEFREHVLSDEAQRMVFVSSKAMAKTVVELMKQPEKINQAKEELNQRLINLYGVDYEKYCK